MIDIISLKGIIPLYLNCICILDLMKSDPKSVFGDSGVFRSAYSPTRIRSGFYPSGKNLFYINEELYCYRIRQNSIMNKMDKNYSRNLKSIIYIYNTLPILFDYNVKDGVFRRCLKEDISKRYLSAIAKYEAYRYPAIARDIRKEEIHKNASPGRDKIRAFVLRLNTKWYCILNNGLKKK